MAIPFEEGMTAADIRAANAAVNKARVANSTSAQTAPAIDGLIPGTSLLDLTLPQNAASARLEAQAKAYFTAFPDAPGNPYPNTKTVVNQPESSSNASFVQSTAVYSTTTVDPTPATPIIKPASIVATTVTAPIKTATPDIVLFDDSLVPIEIMADLVFEDIGGQELINITRNDIINGQKIIYQPIKNIDSINQQYNPNNIVGIQKTSDKYFSGFAIKFDQTVPVTPTSSDENPVYMDASGNIVVESINLKADEQLEIQIAVSGTIYETEI